MRENRVLRTGLLAAIVEICVSARHLTHQSASNNGSDAISMTVCGFHAAPSNLA